jgi:hypothetical protein
MVKPFEGAGNGCHRLNLSNMLAAGLFDGFGHLSVQGAHLEQRRSSVWLVGSLWGRFCGWGSHAGEALAPVPGCSPPGPMVHRQLCEGARYSASSHAGIVNDPLLAQGQVTLWPSG